MDDLTRLPNIGRVLAEKLARIGVSICDELAAMGSVDAVLRIRTFGASACYNMLYALEGAIRGVRWHDLPREIREEVKRAFDLAACGPM